MDDTGDNQAGTGSHYVTLAGLKLVMTPFASASPVLGTEVCATTSRLIHCFLKSGMTSNAMELLNSGIF